MNRRKFIIGAAAIPVVIHLGSKIIYHENELVILHETLDNRKCAELFIRNCTIRMAENFSGDCMIYIDPNIDNYDIQYNVIYGPGIVRLS